MSPSLPLRAPRFMPFGDAALVVEFGDVVDRALSAAVLALDARIAADPPAGFVEATPTFRSLCVVFDPLLTDHDAMAEALRARLAVGELSSEPGSEARLWRFPVVYGGAHGPDLDEVAAAAGLTAEAVAARHQAIEHHVYMIGFLPGAPYLGDLPSEVDLPRRAEPRLSVPAGSVAVAVGLTVIYPFESPGGWRIIGRTPARLFDPLAERPALLSPGDAVRFEPIAPERFDEIAAHAAAGAWTPDWSPRRDV